MGKIDARTYEYLSDSSRFADIVNYYIFDGEQVIAPEQLHEMDATEITFPFGKDNSVGSDIIQKYRDIIKSAYAMYDDNAAYLIIGVENQSEVQYAMPVKDMLYDAEQYTRQVSVISKRHRESKDNKHISSGEFLSGFYKADKLLPVITIVVFWSADEWDGPKSLHDMFSVTDDSILRYIPNYRINLLSPSEMLDDDFEKLHTSVSEALKFIKYSRDDIALQKILDNDKVFTELDRETADLINDITGNELVFEDGEELVNMCLAHENMKKQAVKESSIETAKILLSMGEISIEKIAIATKLPVEEVRKLAGSDTQ